MFHRLLVGYPESVLWLARKPTRPSILRSERLISFGFRRLVATLCETREQRDANEKSNQ